MLGQFPESMKANESLQGTSSLLHVNCFKSDCRDQFCCILYFGGNSIGYLALFSDHCRNKLVEDACWWHTL